MPQSRFAVSTSDQDVTIKYDGKEVLYWTESEWVEDPSVTIAIVNAVQMALIRPSEMYEFLVDKGIL